MSVAGYCEKGKAFGPLGREKKSIFNAFEGGVGGHVMHSEKGLLLIFNLKKRDMEEGHF